MKNTHHSACNESIGKESIINRNEINPNIVYWIKDDQNRFLCMARAPNEEGGRDAFFSRYYETDIATIKFSDYPERKKATLKCIAKDLVNPIDPNDPLKGNFLYNASSSKEDSFLYFWGNDNPDISAPTKIWLTAEEINPSTDGDQYKIIWDNQGTKMFWHSTQELHSVVLTADANNFSLYTFHPMYFRAAFITELLLDLWKIKFRIMELDPLYQPVDAEFIKKLYTDSELANYKPKDTFFIDQDFCLIYKAQASKEAYKNNIAHPYAIGIMWGYYKKKKLVVNIFIDTDLSLWIFDPRSGTIIHPSQWIATPYLVLV
ncbi:MAG: lectin MOA-related protein [Enterobacteriaceae bacterium]|jgi:hypothetical protein|nr:lectin MOA-related protein [Enterobacteriaceae bacterium]